MGSTWGLLIPLTILMATLRHKKKGWWFQLHRALATLSLILVIIGAILGRRLRITHPPVTVAGKCHKVMGYVALSFIVLQVCEQISAAPCVLDHNSITCVQLSHTVCARHVHLCSSHTKLLQLVWSVQSAFLFMLLVVHDLMYKTRTTMVICVHGTARYQLLAVANTGLLILHSSMTSCLTHPA